MNQPKVLAATYDPKTGAKEFTVMVDVPYVLLPELLSLKELEISYKKIDSLYEEKKVHAVIDDWGTHRILLEDQINEGYYVEESQDDPTEYIEYSLNYIASMKVNVFVNKFTTCIITSTDWSRFFSSFCPSYHTPVSGEGFYAKSKKELISWHSNQENLNKLSNSNFDWSSVNYATGPLELQAVAELVYDLYQGADWKECEYHIPFEDEITKLYDIYGWKIKATKNDWAKIPNFEEVGDSDIIKMMVSASMCSRLLYNSQDNETLEDHLKRAESLGEEKLKTIYKSFTKKPDHDLQTFKTFTK